MCWLYRGPDLTRRGEISEVFTRIVLTLVMRLLRDPFRPAGAPACKRVVYTWRTRRRCTSAAGNARALPPAAGRSRHRATRRVRSLTRAKCRPASSRTQQPGYRQVFVQLWPVNAVTTTDKPV